jgi:acyl-coenzyme A thioesterase PaaI-like protein
MPDAENLLDESEVRFFLSGLAFVREFSINVVSLKPDFVTVELPFDERFSGPPNPFSRIDGRHRRRRRRRSILPHAYMATLDFTIKMTGIAKGEALRAKGRVLQDGRTNSIGAADVYRVSDGSERLCGTVLATTRNFKIK